MEGIDPLNLAKTGWGVIFAHGADPATRQAPAPLLDHRKAQAGADKAHYYKEYAGPLGYRPGETKQQFLVRHGVGPGPANPEKVPYYLLIVGDPEAIPFRFQYQLDLQYAVGRIHFDSLAEYAQYARSVVEAETTLPKKPRRGVFFGVRNRGDQATQLSANQLVRPLTAALATECAEWALSTVLAADATKASLGALLGGPETPAFLFTASHGMGFPSNHPLQARQPGGLALPGLAGAGGLAQAHPAGLLPGRRRHRQRCVGPRPDQLPFRLLRRRHAEGGRVRSQGDGGPGPDRASCLPGWVTAAITGAPQRRGAGGHRPRRARLGSTRSPGPAPASSSRRSRALCCASCRATRSAPRPSTSTSAYSELSSDLSLELEDIKFGKTADDLDLSGMWTANNDARSYVILGDPAVRLGVEPVE